MRLRGGRCSACGELTSSTVLWVGAERALRVWCCDGCAGLMNADVRGLLTLAAHELERRAPQTTSTPSA